MGGEQKIEWGNILTTNICNEFKNIKRGKEEREKKERFVARKN